MNKLVSAIFNKLLIIGAIFLSLIILAIYILPFFQPLPWQTVVEDSHYDEDEREFYTDTWPPTTP